MNKPLNLHPPQRTPNLDDRSPLVTGYSRNPVVTGRKVYCPLDTQKPRNLDIEYDLLALALMRSSPADIRPKLLTIGTRHAGARDWSALIEYCRAYLQIWADVTGANDSRDLLTDAADVALMAWLDSSTKRTGRRRDTARDVARRHRVRTARVQQLVRIVHDALTRRMSEAVVRFLSIRCEPEPQH